MPYCQCSHNFDCNLWAQYYSMDNAICTRELDSSLHEAWHTNRVSVWYHHKVPALGNWKSKLTFYSWKNIHPYFHSRVFKGSLKKILSLWEWNPRWTGQYNWNLACRKDKRVVWRVIFQIGACDQWSVAEVRGDFTIVFFIYIWELGPRNGKWKLSITGMRCCTVACQTMVGLTL